MSQKLRPGSDVSNNTWSPTPLYQQLNESQPDDNTYVTSSGADAGDTFKVGLQLANVPGESDLVLPSNGTWTVRVRVSMTGGSGSGSGSGPVGVAIRLFQVTGVGEKTIAERFLTPSAVFSEVSVVLTQAEIDLIEFDEDGRARDLRVQVTTLPPIVVSCCPVPLPAVLYATFSNGTGDCACIGTVTVTIFATPSEWAGHVDNSSCGLLGYGVRLICETGGWTIDCPASYYGVSGTGLSATSCRPFLLSLHGATPTWCSGTVDLDITETAPP